MGKLLAIILLSAMILSLILSMIPGASAVDEKCGFLCSLGRFFSSIFSFTGGAVKAPPEQRNVTEGDFIRVNIEVRKG